MLPLLAVACPPLAVLATGRVGPFVVNAALTLCLYVPGLLHALAAVDRYRTGRRNQALLDAVAAYDARKLSEVRTRPVSPAVRVRRRGGRPDGALAA